MNCVSQLESFRDSWSDKHNSLWADIQSDRGMGGSYALNFVTTSMKTSYDNEWDVMPNGRKKTIHGKGAICPFKIDIAPTSPYTGLLKVVLLKSLKGIIPASLI